MKFFCSNEKYIFLGNSIEKEIVRHLSWMMISTWNTNVETTHGRWIIYFLFLYFIKNVTSLYQLLQNMYKTKNFIDAVSVLVTKLKFNVFFVSICLFQIHICISINDPKPFISSLLFSNNDGIKNCDTNSILKQMVSVYCARLFYAIMTNKI